MEVLDDDADEHVEHEEADEQQERDEVEQAPLVVVDARLHAAIRTATDTPHNKLTTPLSLYRFIDSSYTVNTTVKGDNIAVA